MKLRGNSKTDMEMKDTKKLLYEDRKSHKRRRQRPEKKMEARVKDREMIRIWEKEERE